MDPTFVSRLNFIKAQHKLSYSKLGAILGVSKDTAGNYLLGKTEMSIADIKKLCITLGVDLNWLMTGELPGSDMMVSDTMLQYYPKSVINHQDKIKQLLAASPEKFKDGGYEIYELVEGKIFMVVVK